MRSPIRLESPLSSHRSHSAAFRQPDSVLWNNRGIGRSPKAVFPSWSIPVVFTTQPFVHRINADGSIDSFCRKCLVTIASSLWETELDGAEREHRCDPIQLEYVQGILNRPQA